MVVFCIILTLVCSLRAGHMWLTRNHMFILEIWGKFISLFIFWNFEISLVWLRWFQNLKIVNSVNLSRIFLLNMWLLVQTFQVLYLRMLFELDILIFYVKFFNVFSMLFLKYFLKQIVLILSYPHQSGCLLYYLQTSHIY